MTTEKLLLVAHGGTYQRDRVAIFMSDHCLPIACSHPSWSREGDTKEISEAGLFALWESTSDVEEYFQALGFECIRQPENMKKPHKDWKPEGLYVYEVSYEEEDIYDDESWEHLKNGNFRRPTIEELEPLTKGLPPWNGIVI